MKAVKVIGIVVGVVAIVATAGAALAPAMAATATTAATAGGVLGISAATLSTIGTIAGLAAMALSVGTALFAPKPGFSGQGNPLQFQTNPQSGLPYAIGRTRMSGLKIHADTYDASAYKSEGKQDVLSFAVLLSAGGEIEEIESFKADKEVVAFDGGTGMATGFYANWMAQKISLGLAGASALALAFGGGGFPGWTADHKLSGMAHALWDLRFDEKGEKFGAGVPEPQWIGKWVKVYDPRLDDTYPGGSGPHRALDESTYEWSANPYLHGLTWALGRWQNGKKVLGIGAPIENIRVSDFVEGANVCDANGWTCGGVEWSTDPKWTILKKMLQAGGGEPTMTGAMIGCRVNTPRVSVATVTADKLLDGLSMATTRSRRDRFNTVIPRYRSEDHDWEVISGSPVSVSAYVTDDGGLRTKEIDFPLVQHEVAHDGNKQAGELAAYEIVNSREGGPFRFTVGPEYVGVKTGDVITLDVPDEGLDEQPVLIRSRSIDPATFKITFEAETETEAKHDFALGKTTTPPLTWSPTPPDLTPPTPNAALWDFDFLLTGGTLPLLRIHGVCEFPGADVVLMRYRKVGDPGWITLGQANASEPVDHEFGPVEGGEDYEAEVAYRSGNRTGGWLALGPVTVPAWDLSDFDELYDDFYGSNNQNASAITAPTIPGGGAAIDHVEHANGSVDISFEWNWAGTEAEIDGFEVVTVGRASASAYTIGGTPSAEQKDTMSPDKRAYIVFGAAPDLHWTFYVRAYRVVDPNIDASGRIYSSWVKSTVSGENPYLPNANLPFAGNVTGTIDGEASSNVADATQNFNLRNDRNGAALVDPTIPGGGASIDHTQNVDGSVDLSFEWLFGGAESDIDGFEILLYSRSSGSAYTIGSDPAGELVTRVPPYKRAFIVKGLPAPLNYTLAARSFRIVDPDINASRVLYGNWVKSAVSGEDPYLPNSQVPFTGLIGSTVSGVSATTIAAAVDGGTGKIATGKVVQDSIEAGAINLAGYAQVGGTIFISASSTYDLMESGSETDCLDGETVLVSVRLPLDLELTGSVGTEHQVTLTPIAWKSPSGVDKSFGPSTVYSVVKTSSDTQTGRRIVPVDAVVEIDQGDGVYSSGIRIQTDSNTPVGVYPTQQFNLDNPKAAM